eukprot:6628388-Heterocapsa_arctica.AAC.1
MTAARTADFATKARARGGMPELSDLERPGPTILAKVADNYRFSSAFSYIGWEEYTNEKKELRAHRLGLKPKDMGFKIIAIDDDGLQDVSTFDELERPKTAKQFALQDALK